MSTALGPTGEAVGDLPVVGEKVTMKLANPDKKNDAPDLSAASSGTSNATSPGPKTRAALENKKRRQPWMILAAILLVLISLGLIVGLSVGLTRSSSSRSSSAANSGGVDNNPFGVPTVGPNTPPPPSLRPVASPAPTTNNDPNQVTLQRVQQGRQFLLDGNFAKEADLNDNTTPQARALDFIVLGTAISTIPTSASSDAEQGTFLDRWVAMVLYYSTGGTSWRRQWNVANADESVCRWNGAIPVPGSARPILGGFGCSEQDSGRVTSIRLGNSGLAGTLPTELGLLTDLVLVSLPIGNITGSIPSELTNCRQLRGFEASFNQLQGSLPAGIGAWSEMQILGLSNNLMEKSIPDGFRSLVKLESLALDDNIFTGTLDNLNPLTNLQNLLLEDNLFTGTLMPLQTLNRLRFLDASNNKIGGEIPSFLFNLQDLLVLDLHGNNLIGEIPSGIEPNDRLRILALQRNSDLTGDVPTSMTNLGALTHLDLTSTGFTGTMPTFLGNMTELRYLFLADTEFDDGPIPDEYQNLSFLRDLSLKNSDRTGTIPTWFGNLDSMILLDLHFNDLNGNIPTEIGEMESLALLLLHRNDLTGTIPSEISGVGFRLAAAVFDHNRLTGSAEGACSGIDRTRTFMTSDCNATASGPNDFVVTCPCCTVCCVSSDPSCNEGDNLAQYDPVWENQYQRTGYQFAQDFNITRI